MLGLMYSLTGSDVYYSQSVMCSRQHLHSHMTSQATDEIEFGHIQGAYETEFSLI